ncbi:MAG: radical SAM protein [Calditrichaeota bacterium]|nr:MAG: radical SAM protein [Calditrichota bacterium]
MMARALKSYLQDPFLNQLYREVRQAGPLRSISVDLTHVCNLRCVGCYYFTEGMDRYRSPRDERVFDAFIEREKARGTNFVTVVGGEPTLAMDRLQKLYRHFRLSVATNGLRRIPLKGFENLPIGISVWGSPATDRRLRGSGRVEVFARALKNYRNDPRAFFYYTVSPGNADEIEPVVTRCIENGNAVLFNYYGDLARKGGALDARQGFGRVQAEIERMIGMFPERIFTTAYLSRVVTSGRLYDEQWGYQVCTSLSVDHPVNRERLKNGKPFNPHFRAYNADFQTTRRCCTGIDRDCETCFDTWEHFSWIMLNLRKHLGSKGEFTCWLTTMYLFYWINRIVDYPAGLQRLPEIHRRVNQALEQPPFSSGQSATADQALLVETEKTITLNPEIL